MTLKLLYCIFVANTGKVNAPAWHMIGGWMVFKYAVLPVSRNCLDVA